MEIILICNEKGGAGKSATACCLGNCLTALGYRVLIVDTDPSGNLSAATLPEDPKYVLYDVLRGASTDDFLTDAYDELEEEHQKAIDTAGEDKGDYEDWYEGFFAEGSEAANAWKEAFEDKVCEFVCDTLSSISY